MMFTAIKSGVAGNRLAFALHAPKAS